MDTPARGFCFAAFFLGTTTGCRAEYATDPQEMTDETGASDSGAGETEGEVPEPTLPAEWWGPVMLVEADVDAPLGDCPGGFGDSVTVGYSDIVAPPAACECHCGGAEALECAPVALDVFANSNGCGETPAEQHLLSPGECGSIETPMLAGHVNVGPLEVGGGSCVPETSESVETAAWETQWGICDAPTTAACGDGGCAEAAELDACIATAGEVACPPGPFQIRTVVYEDMEDNRGCEGCTCGDPVGACTGVVQLHTNDWCGQQFGFVQPQECLSVFAVQSLRFEVQAVTGACAPSDPAPTGAAVPTNATTVCCAT